VGESGNRNGLEKLKSTNGELTVLRLSRGALSLRQDLVSCISSTSCNAVFSILTFYAALQSIIVIAEIEEAESIDSAFSVEENEKQIVFESITISPIG
jgi:hypothetical protein